MLQLTSKSVWEYRKTLGKLDESKTELLSTLYQAASEYERNQGELMRRMQNMERAIADVRSGQASWYSFGSTASEIEKAIAARDAAKHLFLTVAKVAGITVSPIINAEVKNA